MTGRPAGLQVGSTKPISRAERRAQAARVQATEVPAAADTDAEPTNSPSEESSLPPAPEKVIEKVAAKQKPATAEVLAQLAPRRREPKRPFSTQLRPSTIERLDWMKSQGYSVTDVVDAALNAYLDSAGAPKPKP